MAGSMPIDLPRLLTTVRVVPGLRSGCLTVTRGVQQEMRGWTHRSKPSSDMRVYLPQHIRHPEREQVAAAGMKQADNAMVSECALRLLSLLQN